MKRPAFQTRVLASVPVMVTAWGSAVLVGLGTVQNPSAWPALVLASGLVALSMKADERVRAYKLWKLEWDGYDAPTVRRSHGTTVGALAIIGAVLFLIFATPEARGVAVVLSLLAALPAGGFLLLRKAVRRQPRPTQPVRQPVAVCVVRPVVPLPPANEMLAALPAYCRQLMSAKQA